MLAINVRGIIAWCAIPKQVLVHVQGTLRVPQTQIHPIALLTKAECLQYDKVQAENVDGRYLEK